MKISNIRILENYEFFIRYLDISNRDVKSTPLLNRLYPRLYNQLTNLNLNRLNFFRKGNLNRVTNFED